MINNKFFDRYKNNVTLHSVIGIWLLNTFGPSFGDVINTDHLLSNLTPEKQLTIRVLAATMELIEMKKSSFYSAHLEKLERGLFSGDVETMENTIDKTSELVVKELKTNSPLWTINK